MKQKLSAENELENSIQCYELRFNIVKCNPYFCNYEDLDGTKSFKMINKKELIKPFALCYSAKNRLERYDIDCFKINTTTDVNIEKISVKIPINQIVSFLSMIKNTATILKEKYSERLKNDVKDNDK